MADRQCIKQTSCGNLSKSLACNASCNCMGCKARPRLILHVLHKSGALRNVPSPVQGTSHRTRSNPGKEVSCMRDSTISSPLKHHTTQFFPSCSSYHSAKFIPRPKHSCRCSNLLFCSLVNNFNNTETT